MEDHEIESLGSQIRAAAALTRAREEAAAMPSPELPPLPEPAPNPWNARVYGSDQLRAYGELCDRAATQRERERCARQCDLISVANNDLGWAVKCAAEIRKGE